MQMQGTVKYFDNNKKFGFIEGEDKQEYFFISLPSLTPTLQTKAIMRPLMLRILRGKKGPKL